VRARRSERIVTTAGATFETTGAYESVPPPIVRSTASVGAAIVALGVLAAVGTFAVHAATPNVSADAAAIAATRRRNPRARAGSGEYMFTFRSPLVSRFFRVSIEDTKRIMTSP
jgi:hypothetical protein